MSSETQAVTNARIITRHNIIDDAAVIIEDGCVAEVTTRRVNGLKILDARGKYVLPGFVDLHSDAIEQEFAPRPGAELTPELAFIESDRAYASAGITTAFDAIAFIDLAPRTIDRAHQFTELIDRGRTDSLVRHELHLRFEVLQADSIAAAETWLPQAQVRLASVTDHGTRGWLIGDSSDDDDETMTVDEIRDHFRRLVGAAKTYGAALASHDDFHPAAVENLATAGFTIAEMPINSAAAARAKDLGMFSFMGAPNIVRGYSYAGNISALEAAQQGLLLGLCSDYHPPSLLQAVFKLARIGLMSLPEAVALATTAPARAVGLDDRGEIREGALADLIVVGEQLGLPVVTNALVGGWPVYQVDLPSKPPNSQAYLDAVGLGLVV